MKKIRVLVVDDSLFMRKFITSELTKDLSIEVVGEAADPYEARDRISELLPDVMTLDIHMPKMDGIRFLEKLMPQFPLPVVVVSSVSHRVFDALNAGAVDFVNKTAMKNNREKMNFASELIVKIKIASIAKVGQHKHNTTQRKVLQSTRENVRRNDIIAIGASTGGTEATYNILKHLGNDLPGMVIVQHMPPVFTRLYAQRLNNNCAMEVKEAEDGDELYPGRVLIAPGGLHLTVEKEGRKFRVKCFEGDKVSGHCPSVDQLFYSIAKIRGINSLGIILTGMGSDGAKGLLAMKQQGAETIGQNQATCVVYGMPAVANNIGAVDTQLPLNAIPAKIYEWCNLKLSKDK